MVEPAAEVIRLALLAIFGAGAGVDAASVAVMSGVVAIARDRAAVVPALLTSNFKLQTSNFPMEAV